MSQTAIATGVSHVAVKLPPYWPKDPSLWFAQVEGQFDLAGITTEMTKFNHVMSQLPAETAQEVRDIILSPPSNPYTMLKAKLISRTSQSAAERVKMILDPAETANTKPSHILRALKQQLEGMAASEALLTNLFVQKLPIALRPIVAAQIGTVGLEELAGLADRVQENLPDTSNISTVSPTSPSTQDWELRLTRLENMVEKLAVGNHNTPRSRNASRSPSRSAVNPNGLCYYHSRFRERAFKCTQPCSWIPSSRSANTKNGSQQ